MILLQPTGITKGCSLPLLRFEIEFPWLQKSKFWKSNETLHTVQKVAPMFTNALLQVCIRKVTLTQGKVLKWYLLSNSNHDLH